MADNPGDWPEAPSASRWRGRAHRAHGAGGSGSRTGLFTLQQTIVPARKDRLRARQVAVARFGKRDGGIGAGARPGAGLAGPGVENGSAIPRFDPISGVKTSTIGRNSTYSPVFGGQNVDYRPKFHFRTLARSSATVGSLTLRRKRDHGSVPGRHAAPRRAGIRRRAASTSRIVTVGTGYVSLEENSGSVNRLYAPPSTSMILPTRAAWRPPSKGVSRNLRTIDLQTSMPSVRLPRVSTCASLWARAFQAVNSL